MSDGIATSSGGAGLPASLRRRAIRACEFAVQSGAPPAWFDWRWMREETLSQYFARGGAGTVETLQPQTRLTNPMPQNISDLERLPNDAGWWGYAMRDVPTRISGATLRATLPDCRIVAFTEPSKNNFFPAIVNRDKRSLHLREVAFRPPHRAALRGKATPRTLDKATWFIERVYHNHSHWLTAQLPKLCLLKARGELGDLVLPRRRNAVIDASLKMLGIDAEDFAIHDPDRPLDVGELTLLDTDRFRPELLRPVREALAIAPHREPWRRVFISRAESRGRTLLNQADIEPILEKAGFEPVLMERLSFPDQVRLMGETKMLLAPHGAGLTNMMFCSPGTHIIEIADLSFPNPNFYALACAMELPYWLVEGKFAGGDDLHPLDRSLTVEPEALRRVLRQIDV